MDCPRQHKGLIAVALAAALALVWPAVPRAATHVPQDQVQEKLRDGAAKILEAIELMIRSIPTYGMPRIDENGDIIIPRRGGPPDIDPEDAPDRPADEIPPDPTKT